MSEDLKKVIAYMQAHWPSEVKPEWQVKLEEYPAILAKVVADFTPAQTKNRHFIRLAGISGSGKTTQILPAVEAYCEKHEYSPILIAARRFVEYHPHYQEIKDFYGDENLRKNTDEFSTIMLFMTLSELIKEGYDIILDVTLLDESMEEILVNMLKAEHYKALLLMIAVSPTVTEHFLQGRAWRHAKETEQEFIRATAKALEFYARVSGEMRIILWSVYDRLPVYDGPVKGVVDIFKEYSARTDLPKNDDDIRRETKIKYLTTDLD
ncbi:zeta toxin family protein [Candidatus Saccharibacteria bacterium]|nr:zeta toxin family protein [Candidatus Saccharibacteria bacterium]